MNSLSIHILGRIVEKVNPELYSSINKTFYTLADSYHIGKYYYNQYEEFSLINYLYMNSWQDPKVVEHLIRQGADINEYDDIDLKPPFMYAVNAEILQILLQKGVEPSEYHDRVKGCNALFFVKDSQMAQLLINAGVDINNTDNEGDTALFYARSSEIARTLIKNGADINHRNNYNSTPLHVVKSADIAQVLIASKADVNALDNFNSPPLAYSRGGVVRVLLAAGADPNLVQQ